MSKQNFSLFISLCLIALSFQSCMKDTCEASLRYISYEPVYKTPEEIRHPIAMEVARDLENPGKIFYYNNIMLVNEIREGVHFIDNSEPENPINFGFLPIDGNVDISVSNNILYADNYMDLLAIDLSNINAPVLVDRIEDVFHNLTFDSELGYIVDYTPTQVTQEIPCSDPYYGYPYFYYGEDVLVAESASTDGSFNSSDLANNNTSPQNGIAGSMSRFALYQNMLYAIDGANLQVYDIAQANNPDYINQVPVSWDIETLFPYKNYLFIGSQSGMFIFDNSNASNPTYVSKFEHARACDPVYVKNDIAYVTLRDGTVCEGFENQLDVIDVSNLLEPQLIKSYPMLHPHGLTIQGNYLYLCEGTHGLKVLDISNNENISTTEYIENFDTYDAIAIPNQPVVMVIGKDGFYQFDTTDPSDLRQLSVIPVRQ
ncbi:MAG: hypothetical protein R2798_01500 [Chitinophagales bacterium]|nr:hypothetical protein [Bacteroidota bacterium]MCB9042885.1 hypothetical protein [Chitinophagales bacterium]